MNTKKKIVLHLHPSCNLALLINPHTTIARSPATSCSLLYSRKITASYEKKIDKSLSAIKEEFLSRTIFPQYTVKEGAEGVNIYPLKLSQSTTARHLHIVASFVSLRAWKSVALEFFRDQLTLLFST